MAEKKQIPVFEFKGIPKITIPITDEEIRNSKDFGKKILMKYMPSILQKHKKNRKKIDFCYNYALGEQDINAKERLYLKDSENNNKIVENHAYRHTRFKAGFITSQKRSYSHKTSSECTDMTYLDNYFTDVNYFEKDKNVKEWVYATGIGTTYHCHRTDIVTKNIDGTYSFVGDEDGFDYKTNAPFEFDDLDPRDNFVVYSSVRGNKPLFCVSLVTRAKPNEMGVITDSCEVEYKLYIETRYARFTATCTSEFGGFKDIKKEVTKTYHSMPMVEHCSNKERIGVVELLREMYNCLNILVSNVLDMVVDGANVIMVFKNTDIKQETINEMLKKGAILLYDKQDNKNNSEAKLDTISIKIDFAGLNSFYEERLTQTYNIAGVPLASGQVTSGGDTGQARLLGNGWENSYMMSNSDITTFIKCDYEVLKGIIAICKDVPDCPIKTISASEIEIKYHINQSDNLLSKAEAIKFLYDVHFPKEEILKATNLISDICAVANKWENYEQDLFKKGEEEHEKALKNATKVVTDDGSDTNVGTKDGEDKNVPTITEKDNNSKE